MADGEGKDKPFIAPNGAMFVRESVRKGILPLMLQEILDTRQMIKRSMKAHAKMGGGDVLQRVLEARQLALKLIANGKDRILVRMLFIFLLFRLSHWI